MTCPLDSLLESYPTIDIAAVAWAKDEIATEEYESLVKYFQKTSFLL